MPRVALLALTVLAQMVNVAQRASPDHAVGSRATIALSAMLFAGVILLVIILPVVFFRAKIQDAKEKLEPHQVSRLLPDGLEQK